MLVDNNIGPSPNARHSAKNFTEFTLFFLEL